MINEQEVKVESSIPVQSRVDIRVLAEMVLYWEGEGRYIKTMSQLINWSMDLATQILKINNLLPTTIDTILDANEELTRRGLYQPGMKKRGAKKLVRGRQLENLRMEGVDVETWAEGKGGYAKAHNRHSVIPAPELEHTISPEREAMYADSDKRNTELDEQERKDIIGNLQTDENGIVLQPDMTGTYTAEDRKADIAKAKDALGINDAQPTVESPITSGSPITSVNKTLAKSLLDKIVGSSITNKGLAKVDDRPRKSTEVEIALHEQRVKDKDDALRASWDSALPIPVPTKGGN